MARREIDGVPYICEKLPAERGLELFLRTSAALTGARGLFEAIASDSEDPEVIRAFFEFSREMDPKVLHPLIMELAALSQAADGADHQGELDVRGLVELAFFAIGVNFGSFLPVGLGVLFSGPEAAEAASASTRER
jgi:hypothetical protein